MDQEDFRAVSNFDLSDHDHSAEQFSILHQFTCKSTPQRQFVSHLPLYSFFYTKIQVQPHVLGVDHVGQKLRWGPSLLNKRPVELSYGVEAFFPFCCHNNRVEDRMGLQESFLFGAT